jgi:hypothetical protein
VYPAEEAERLVSEVSNLLEVADIAYDALRGKPFGAQAIYGLVKRGPFDVCQHDAGAAAREPLRRGEADATGAAGDDSAPSFEPIHGSGRYACYFKQLPASTGNVTPVM